MKNINGLSDMELWHEVARINDSFPTSTVEEMGIRACKLASANLRQGDTVPSNDPLVDYARLVASCHCTFSQCRPYITGQMDDSLTVALVLKALGGNIPTHNQ